MIGKLDGDLKESIDAYVRDGRPTGGFLQACIENDLSEAVKRADENNLRRIPEIVSYLYNDCPSYCWGFKGAFERWLEVRRLELDGDLKESIDAN